MRTFCIELPDLPVWTLNNRGHWSDRAELVAQWRAIAAQRARAQAIPKGLARVEVELMMVPADRRRRDPDNLAGALKPCLDGLVDAGVIPDDRAEHVQAVTLRVATPTPERFTHRWLLTVVDVSDELQPDEAA